MANGSCYSLVLSFPGGLALVVATFFPWYGAILPFSFRKCLLFWKLRLLINSPFQSAIYGRIHDFHYLSFRVSADSWSRMILWGIFYQIALNSLIFNLNIISTHAESFSSKLTNFLSFSFLKYARGISGLEALLLGLTEDLLLLFALFICLFIFGLSSLSLEFYWTSAFPTLFLLSFLFVF